LHVSWLVVGEQWRVYTLAGVLVAEGKEESVKLPYSGIYIVKQGKRQLRIKN
jgi:hypothetical protein